MYSVTCVGNSKFLIKLIVITITSDVLIFDLNFVSVKCFQEDFEKLAFQKAYLEIRFCVSKINVSEKLVSSFRCS